MFWIDAADDHSTKGEVCPVCNGVHPVYETLDHMAYDCTLLTLHRSLGPHPDIELAMRTAGIDSTVVGFLEAELAAALALAEDALSLTPAIKALFQPYLNAAMRADDVYEAMGRADRYWRNNSFTKGTAGAFSEAMTLAVATGIVKVNDAVKVDALFRNRMIDGMNRSAKYYSNEFFNRQVMPSLVRAVEQSLSGNAAGGLAGYRMVQETLNARLKSVPYWGTVASAAASRSYHYGMVRAGMAMGRSRYRFRAVRDERTTYICSAMDGTEWALDDAVNLMERIASAEDPEEVKKISPWLKLKDIKGMGREDIRSLGIIMPPLHHRCRSTIILV